MTRVIGARSLRGIQVAETPGGGVLRVSHWEALDPKLRAGITVAAHGDFAVAGAAPAQVGDVYSKLARELGFGRVSVPDQIHGTSLGEVRAEVAGASDRAVAGGRPAVVRAGSVDGQLAGDTGWLLAATVADCVPVYLWHRASGRVGLVHAGWRGTAAAILPRALSRLRRTSAARAAAAPAAGVRVHLGPAICGRCYKVDTPVLSAFGLRGERAHLDLRGMLAAQAITAGVAREALSSSRHCTACGPIRLHSHRASGGAAGRMAAFLGLRGD